MQCGVKCTLCKIGAVPGAKLVHLKFTLCKIGAVPVRVECARVRKSRRSVESTGCCTWCKIGAPQMRLVQNRCCTCPCPMCSCEEKQAVSRVNWVAPIGKPHPATALIGLAYRTITPHCILVNVSCSIYPALYRCIIVSPCISCIICVSQRRHNHNLWLRSNWRKLQQEF